SHLLDRTSARRLVVLGDLLHAAAGRTVGVLATADRWRVRHRAIDVLLVRGNHDRHAGDPPPELDIRCVMAPYPEPPFVFAHHPPTSNDGYVLAGHLHPAVRLHGPARQSMRLPCFWIRDRYAVLPAFGDFTGTMEVTATDGDQVFAVAGTSVRRMEA